MKSFLFDTCFLIDLEREMRQSPGKAQRFLRQNADVRPCVSWTVAGEFAEGFGSIYHPACAAMLAHFHLLGMNESTAHHYAVAARHLRGLGLLIGANDLWIGATAMAHAVPVVTSNSAHFLRIPGLSVVGYS